MCVVLCCVLCVGDCFLMGVLLGLENNLIIL